MQREDFQLLKYQKEIPDSSLGDAVRVCCQQRNSARLFTMSGVLSTTLW